MEPVRKSDQEVSPLWAEFREKAKTDPELARLVAAAERVMEKNREALKKLADS